MKFVPQNRELKKKVYISGYVTPARGGIDRQNLLYIV